MAQIDPEEVQALLGRESAGRERQVAVRDFKKPRRLSSAQRNGLEALITGALGRIQGRLSELTNEQAKVELVSIGEVDARGLFEADEGVASVVSFDADGALGWLAWESPAAVSAVERLLGSGSSSAEARPLSPLESGILIELTTPFVSELAGVLEISTKGYTVHQELPELLLETKAAGELDPHRVEIELSLERAEVVSAVRCYLPGLDLQGPAGPSGKTASLALPSPANAVPVAIQARLIGCDVPLSQLLALEAGDVIPLEDRTDQPVLLTVAGKRYGTARLGTSRGRLAVRIQEIDKDTQR